MDVKVCVFLLGFNCFIGGLKIDEILVKNFFDNLEGHPGLIGDGEFSDKSRSRFVDQQIENFSDLKLTQRLKRSTSLDNIQQLTRDNKGFFKIESVISSDKTIPAQYPEDLVMFKQNQNWYAAALESPDPKSFSNILTLFLVKGEKFEKIIEKPVENATKIGILSDDDFTLIAVIASKYSKIFKYQNNELKRVQKIKAQNEIVFWKFHHELFLSTPIFQQNQSFQLQTPIYKWMGKHFDIMQKIDGKGAKSVTPFKIGENHYLAVCNHQEYLGKTTLYSEIYKHNSHTDLYEIYQRIFTYGCLNFKFFTFTDGLFRENFIIIASDKPILYKWDRGYFVPFQSFASERVEKWLSIQGGEKFALLAITEYGVKFYQYDGWTFRETTTRNDIANSKIRSIQTLIFYENPILVLSFKKNPGDSPNIFTINFIHQNTLKETQVKLLNWCQSNLEKVQSFSIVSKRSDIDDEIEPPEFNSTSFDQIQEQLESLNLQLTQIEEYTENLIKNITATEVIVNTAQVIRLKTRTINDVNIDGMLKQSIKIDENFNASELYLDALVIEKIPPNGTIKNLVINNLTVNGNFTLHNFNVITINDNLSINPDNILLHKKQNIVKFSLNELKADTLEMNHLHNLTVRNLTIDGFINEIYLPTIEKYAIKTVGDQEITANCYFNDLTVENLFFDKINNRILEDFIFIDEGEYTVEDNVIFTQDLKVNRLEVEEFFNNLQVVDGKLDVLLKNSIEPQHMHGLKAFKNLDLANPIHLQVKIQSKEFDRINNVVTINKTLNLVGDFHVSGDVRVVKLLKINDLTTPNNTYSLYRLQNDGLKLTDKEIGVKLNFVQQINVDDIFVEKVNGVEIKNFVVNAQHDTQIISVNKIFKGDLIVTGDTEVVKINDVDVGELDKSVLRVEGDQIITGKHHIKKLFAKNIKSNIATANNTPFPPKFNISEITVNSNVKINNLTINKIYIKGLFDDINFTEMVENTIQKNSTPQFTGHKTFKNLAANSLVIRVDKFSKFDNLGEEIIVDKLVLNDIAVKHLKFTEYCNGVKGSDFGSPRIEDNVTTISEDQILKNAIIYGKLHIKNEINNVNISRILYDTVKRNEPITMENVEFEHAVISNIAFVEGQMESLDLENILIANSEKAQEIYVQSLNTLTVMGDIKFEGLVNGGNITQICNYSPKNLVVERDAYFLKEPDVFRVNNYQVNDIFKNAWFENEDTTLSGKLGFDNVIFEQNINIGGFVDNVNISWLEENYLSKTKNQTVTSSLTFEDLVVFEKELNVPKINVEGTVNGIKLEQFIEHVLLNEFDQIFENTLHFEKFYIDNLNGDFLVNDLDLSKDVMLYGAPNLITGSKIFNNITIDNLKLEKAIKLQNVDILSWIQNAFYKSRINQNITRKIFNNPVFDKGFTTELLNKAPFNSETILLKNQNQDIIGEKLFHSKILDPVTFKNIKLKGEINELDLFKLVTTQAFKNSNNTFKSSVNFYNSITTENLVVNDFQDVNIPQLLVNVTGLGQLNNLVEKYEHLQISGSQIQKALEGQAYFLHYYKQIQEVENANTFAKTIFSDGTIGFSTFINHTGYYYRWNETFRQFTIDFERYLGALLFKSEIMDHYSHYESKTDPLYSGGDHSHMIRLIDTTTLESIKELRTNGTLSTIRIEIPQEFCFLIILKNCNPKIQCFESELQELDAPGAYKASSLIINKTPYLVIVQRDSDGDSYISIWVYKNTIKSFIKTTQFYEAETKTLDVVNFKNDYFIAIASGRKRNAMYTGRIDIRKYNKKLSEFESWQILEISTPIDVKFAILPSQELVLYILTANPAQPLLIYRYKGVGGFREKFVAITMTLGRKIEAFNMQDRHFVAVGNGKAVNVIEAVFKGRP